MPGKNVSYLLTKDLSIVTTEKEITAFGGMSLMARYFRRIGLMEALASALPEEAKRSNNSILGLEIALAFLVGVLRGAHRFAHVAMLRWDTALQAVFGFRRPPSGSVVTRWFGTFRRVHVEHLWTSLSRFVWLRVPAPRWGHTLDLDSTVFVRYGNQEGSRKGYNPKKKGRPSHHPLMAFLAEAKMILHMWLRSGNAGTARGAAAFLEEALSLLPEGHRIYAVRADSGFCDNGFLTYLEREDLPYAVSARFTTKVQWIVGSQVKTWRRFGPGLDVGETTYLALGWKKPRRMVVIRETIAERKEARGRKLFDCPGYTFHALVTTLSWPPEDVWRFYNSRADAENRIQEFAEVFAAKGFCVQSFFGTEAAVRLIAFLYNMVALFKQEVLRKSEPKLDRLRSMLLAVGAILGMENGKKILRISVKGHLRESFKRLLDRLNSIIPTASQFNPNRSIP